MVSQKTHLVLILLYLLTDKVKHINIKFKDLEFDLKQVLVEKLPNNLTIGQGTSRVVNREKENILDFYRSPSAESSPGIYFYFLVSQKTHLVLILLYLQIK